jgi:hypothetical protein
VSDEAKRDSEKVLTRSQQIHYYGRVTKGAEYYHVIQRLLSNEMDEKARLTILIDPAKKKAFEELCSSQDMTSSQMVRQLIRQYLEKHGVNWVPADKRKLRAK